MINLDPECYGQFFDNEKCQECCFRTSCEFYKKTENIESQSFLRMTNYDAIKGLREVAVYDDMTDDTITETIDLLTKFFSYLVDLDDYSLGILLQIMRPDADSRQSVSSLAAKHKCSRQAMHRKILDIIADRPELSILFRNILYKLPASRWLFLYDRARKKRPQSEKKK